MSLPMIHEVRFYRIAGYDVGAILYGDTWAILSLQQHPTILGSGIVVLHPSRVWYDRLEPVFFEGDRDDNFAPATYAGAVKDDRLALLIQEMLELKQDGEFDTDPRYMGAFDEWPDLWG